MITIPVWCIYLAVTLAILLLVFHIAFKISGSGGSDYFGIGAGFSFLIFIGGLAFFTAFWAGWFLRGCSQ